MQLCAPNALEKYLSQGVFFISPLLIYFDPMRKHLTTIGVLALLIVAIASCATSPDAEVWDDEPDAVLEPLESELEVYQAISLAFAMGDPEEALAAFITAEQSNPEAPETQVLLANLHLSVGDGATAAQILNALYQENQENQDVIFSLALLAGARGDEEEKERLLAEVLALNPQWPPAQAAMGEILLRAGDTTGAQAAFEISLQEEPQNMVALMGLANTFLRDDKPREAEHFLNRAIEADEQYAFAWADRAQARIQLRDWFGAEADLTRAIELDPQYPWHHIDRGRLRSRWGNPEGAVEDYSAALQLQGDQFMTRVFRARALEQLDRRDEAISDYAAALSLRPDYQPARLPLAVLLFEQEDFIAAAEQFDRAFQDTPRGTTRDTGLIFLSFLSRSLGGDRGGARSYLERMSSELPRTGIQADMARYLLGPTSDQAITQAVRGETNRVLRNRYNFYLAVQYELDRRTSTARAIYREVGEANTPGMMEPRLAAARQQALEGNP